MLFVLFLCIALNQKLIKINQFILGFLGQYVNINHVGKLFPVFTKIKNQSKFSIRFILRVVVVVVVVVLSLLRDTSCGLRVSALRPFLSYFLFLVSYSLFFIGYWIFCIEYWIFISCFPGSRFQVPCFGPSSFLPFSLSCGRFRISQLVF